MKLRAFIIGILFFQSGIIAQNKVNFPEDYYGSYKGDLVIMNAKGKQTIPMEFHLRSTDTVGTYVYQLVYISNGNREVRDYKLIEKDKTKGEYVVDENNGILLEATAIGNKLMSVFEVQNSLLMTTETFYEDHMLFEIVFARTDNKSQSGNVGNTIPEVTSFPVSVYQSAKLKKLED
ncbi:MAG: hypothetical protein AAGH46_01555 [Bacteroidota bacterium]